MTDQTDQEARQRVGPRRMLTIQQVLEIVPVSRTTLFRMERDGRFPASHWPSPGCRVWFEDDVAAWQETVPVNSRINSRRRRKSAA